MQKCAMGRIIKNDQWVESIFNKQNMQWVEILRILKFSRHSMDRIIVLKFKCAMDRNLILNVFCSMGRK